MNSISGETPAFFQPEMQRAMDLSWKAQFQDYHQFHKQWKGEVVLLVGTSTAGKTSIIQALKKLDPDVVEDGGDLRSYAISLSMAEKINPDEVEILKGALKEQVDISKAIDSKERNWKEGVAQEDKKGAEEAIKRIQTKWKSLSKEELEDLEAPFRTLELKMITDAYNFSGRGGKIIFDLLNIDAFFKERILNSFDGPLKVVLAYCPFHVLSSRMEKRSREAAESGEFSNQRIGAFPLIQFSELYGEGQPVLERLTREEAIKSFDENFDKGVAAAEGGSLPSPEEILQDKEKQRATFLQNLGFKPGVDTVEIAPKNQWFYHAVLDTSRLSAEEAAKRIKG